MSVQHGADALSDILSRADDAQPATATASSPPPSPAPAARPPQAPPPAKAPPAPVAKPAPSTPTAPPVIKTTTKDSSGRTIATTTTSPSGTRTTTRPRQPLPAEPAELKPYGGPGGGHHVPAKRAFEGAPGYDLKKALAIPNAELDKLGVKHAIVTGAQRKRYKAFAETGQPLTWEAIAKIETEALVDAKMNLDMAQATVAKAIKALRDAGISAPVSIPWGK
ncbi:MAG: hypothetical protein IPM54_26020 [Polyangiaceae bacterium]|nr:hypothetical protein [Polyangiaceae bacterium]